MLDDLIKKIRLEIYEPYARFFTDEELQHYIEEATSKDVIKEVVERCFKKMGREPHA